MKLLDFKVHYKALATKMTWYWHENRHTDQCNRMEIPEISQWIYSQLNFDKLSQIHNGERTISSISEASVWRNLYGEEWNQTLTSHYILKWSWNGLKT
jgi:hypothetical protein